MAKTRKSISRKPVTRQKSKKSSLGISSKNIFLIVLGLFFCFALYRYREALLYYFSFKTNKTIKVDKVTQARIVQVLSNHEGKTFGFDVSEYQGDIHWETVDSIEGFKLDFVFIRATAGNDNVDNRFKENWRSAKKHGFTRGAYHYYRPDENSLEQAQKFIKTVSLSKGDFPPVLDIEKLPENQSVERLKIGLKRWLTTVEKHYGVKPIIYSADRYHQDFLKKEFKEYTFWIANYNFWIEEIKDDWQFWQFTEKAVINGISEKVDVNIYNGSPKMLQYQVIN